MKNSLKFKETPPAKAVSNSLISSLSTSELLLTTFSFIFNPNCGPPSKERTFPAFSFNKTGILI